MSDEPTKVESLVLEQLRHIRAKLDRMEDDGRENRSRLGHLEASTASMSNRLDRMYDMLEVVFKRLELVDS